MSDSVYRVTEVIGVSAESWEAAARNAVETAAKSVRDLRVAEATRFDVTIENGKVIAYRVRLDISFKYEGSGPDRARGPSVAYPRGEVRPSDFRLVEVDVPEPRAGRGARPQHVDVGRSRRFGLRLRERAPRGVLRSVPARRTDGRNRDSRRGRRLHAPTGFAPGDVVRHGAGWRDYAVVRGGCQESLGGVATLTRLDVDAAPPEAYLGVRSARAG